MNVEYINPFIEASQSVCTMMTGNKLFWKSIPEKVSSER